ncbi:MULE transposase domain-containing protein [Purpureocillium lavendulum]|uniref:MULE transposase domain-containing protein n=1 Tax=Purpureocillium lavendulum TaxID=1247861 RepID=A0AB34FFT5_9HYPO|nr:MULE transposase domain-containing protein [Purpureocillium lavendulum]
MDQSSPGKPPHQPQVGGHERSNKSRRVPAELRQRTEHSCDRCKSRKQKCSTWPGETRCRHCLKYGYDCVVTKPRKQRSYGSPAVQESRVAILESLVKRAMPEVDTSNMESLLEMGRSLKVSIPDGVRLGLFREAEIELDNDTSRDDEQLVQDLQGQSQYIGRASSYLFQMKLRALVGGRQKSRQMYLFGPNPTDSHANHETSPSPHTGNDQTDIVDISSTAAATTPGSTLSIDITDPPHTDEMVTSSLVRVFFEQVNADFPVLHEATFLETIEEWRRSPSHADPAWFCGFLCVLILARRLPSNLAVASEYESHWWLRIQSLLSKILFTSSLASIQALLLAALHLHNTGSRDTCWTLTGAAARIGFAIGLHRDRLDVNITPLAREMRKRVWWTLYSFEQVQVSSHDRPSALDSIKHLGGASRESFLDMGMHVPPEYTVWSNRLVALLGAACRVLPESTNSSYMGAAGLLKELSLWRAALPKHLSTKLIDSMPPSFQRPLILLHVQYHYTTSLISRNALLARFMSLSKSEGCSISESVVSMADVCIESGRLLSQLLLKLDAMTKFNATTWLDTYYLYSAVLVLTLSIMCDVRQDKLELAFESQRNLSRCLSLSTKHLANPMVPSTMRRWLSVVETRHRHSISTITLLLIKDSKMQISNILSVVAVLAGVACAAPAEAGGRSRGGQQQNVNYAEIAQLVQRFGNLRNSVLGQIQQITGDDATTRIAGQFNLGEPIQRLNKAANEINSAIETIQSKLQSAQSEYSSNEGGSKNFF